MPRQHRRSAQNKHKLHLHNYTEMKALLNLLITAIQRLNAYKEAKSLHKRGHKAQLKRYNQEKLAYFDKLRQFRLKQPDFLPTGKPFLQSGETFLSVGDERILQLVEFIKDTAADQLFFTGHFKNQPEQSGPASTAAYSHNKSEYSESANTLPTLNIETHTQATILFEEENPGLITRINTAKKAVKQRAKRITRLKRQQKCKKQGGRAAAVAVAAVAVLGVGRTAFNWGVREKLGDLSLSSDPNLENKDLSDMWKNFWHLNAVHTRNKIDPSAAYTTVSAIPEFWEIMAKNKDMVLQKFGNEPPAFCSAQTEFPQDQNYRARVSYLKMRTAYSAKECGAEMIVNDAVVLLGSCLISMLYQLSAEKTACLSDRTCRIRDVRVQQGWFWNTCEPDLEYGTYPRTVAHFEGVPPFASMNHGELPEEGYELPGVYLQLGQ